MFIGLILAEIKKMFMMKPNLIQDLFRIQLVYIQEILTVEIVIIL